MLRCFKANTQYHIALIEAGMKHIGRKISSSNIFCLAELLMLIIHDTVKYKITDLEAYS